MLLVTALAMVGCGNIDNPLEEIQGGSSPSSEPSGITYVAYTASGSTATPTTKTLEEGTYTEVTAELAELTADKPYLVNSDVTIDHDITISGDAELIICDGKTLTINGTINNTSYSLSLYGQTNETGTLKVMCADPTGGRTICLKKLNISGINLIATTAKNYAIDIASDFNIYHGSINAQNTSTGDGQCVAANNMNVYDGCTIDAIGREKAIEAGNSINIYGGNITATAKYSSSGIGGYAVVVPGGTLNMYGGILTANGGDAKDGSDKVGGIGIILTSITISGGTLNAFGGNGDSNEDGGCGIKGTVNLNDGTVNATGGNGGNTGNGGSGIISTSSEQAVDFKGGHLIAVGGDKGSAGTYNGQGITYADAYNGGIKNSSSETVSFDYDNGTSGWTKHGTAITINDKAYNASFGIRLPSEL